MMLLATPPSAIAVISSSLLLLGQPLHVADATLACTSSYDCEAAFLRDSECINGICSNPFHKSGGCLRSMLQGGWHKPRTCGSDDPPEAAALGYCRPSPSDYMEIRVPANNWDSHIFNAWILQIILTEMMDVPVSIEAFSDGVNLDFYSQVALHQYGPGNTWGFEPYKTANLVGDCRVVKDILNNSGKYLPCAHFNQEVWLQDLVERSQHEGIIEAPSDLGMMVSENWFVPKYTAADFPSVASYLGLAGEENREKLAGIFKRPTTWSQYCDEVAACPDSVASRAPTTEEEGNHYFVPGVFEGHFRYTDENNCTANPTTCTGHIVDYPCAWISFVRQQAYHNKIALKSSGPDGVSGGYSFEHILEIWRAANATRSHVMMLWWWPEPLYQDHVGTDSELTPVTLPRPTQLCLDNRISSKDISCAASNVTSQVGSPEGACDYTPMFLKKIAATRLRQITRNPETPRALWSPAMDVFSNYKLSSLQVSEIFTQWRSRRVDPYGFDPRHAVCDWVVRNFDLVKTYVPESYPRIIVDGATVQKSSITRIAFFVACASMALILLFGGLIWQRRKKRIIVHTQLEFIYVIMAGLLMVSLGALVLAMPATDGSCTVFIWLVNLGYATALAPTTFRIDAINRLANSGKRMKRLRQKKKTIYCSALVAILVIGAFCLAWTVLDGPYRDVSYNLTEAVTNLGETIVIAVYRCSSDSHLWLIFSLAWQTCLLICALVLVIMASRIKDDLNDSRNLALLVLSMFVYLSFRIALTALEGSIGPSRFTGGLSFILAADCISAVLILVVPKLYDRNEEQQETDDILPDLFLNSTIMIGDISGFTAWSSVRDPAQVFRFLDTLYVAFDGLAEKRGVFKVETVRDCYVAATGIPSPQKDHAVIMAKYATDVMLTMHRLTHELEIDYGPSEISLRVGLASGPVTGGFMKGKGGRFQLFGDTMGLAVNIERAGERGRIHLSEQTGDLLIAAGKRKWLQERNPPAYIKGKGEVKSFWLNRFVSSGTTEEAPSISDNSVHSEDAAERALWSISHGADSTELHRHQRLIDWNVQVLQNLLKQIVARRRAGTDKVTAFRPTRQREDRNADLFGMGWRAGSSHNDEESEKRRTPTVDESSVSCVEGSIPLQEVEEIIHLPEFDRHISRRIRDANSVVLPDSVIAQLQDVVTEIASMYNDNPFHNLKHASHVVQAVLKMMKRIVAASDLDLGQDIELSPQKAAAALHDHTYGITSDPLTQFACAFSALIHDAAHPGCPNPQLIKEDPDLATKYRGRSVAEQNSFDLAWNLMMEARFKELRQTICGRHGELSRFRQLVINSVMATDLGDKELKALRNARWDKAFKAAAESAPVEPESDSVNRKATIVIEHIIQAADVSHTMQHWHVYREWNENLFREMYQAYKAGRADKNPAEFWYDGEIGFFDFYIIPLSKKLADCGVFGATSDENLNYARNNRAEWVAKGREVVAEMVEKIRLEAEGEHTEEVLFLHGDDLRDDDFDDVLAPLPLLPSLSGERQASVKDLDSRPEPT